MSTFREASAEMHDAWSERRSTALDQEYSGMPMRLVDDLIADLEECNLNGRQRVPESMASQLETLGRLLPARFAAELRIRVAVSRLMDHLYEVAQYLLDLRIGDRSAYDAEDRDAEDTAAPRVDYQAAS